MFRIKRATFVVVASVLGVSAVAEAKATGVRALSDPPAKAAQQFTLRVSGSATRVTLFAAYVRRHGRADLKLGTVVVRRHKVKVSLPRRLAPGAYFIIACPSSGRGSCAASRKATVLLPKSSSVLRNGAATTLSSAAASSAIGETGGTLKATAPWGTVTLQVPRRSLANSVLPAGCTFEQVSGFWRRVCSGSTAAKGPTVTVTSLRALSGLGSFGRFVAGAQLRPEGIPLIRGATVTIALKRPIAKAKMVAVAYSGTGTGIHRVPMRISRGEAVVALGAIGGGVAILDKSTVSAKASSLRLSPSARTAAGAPGSVIAGYQAVIAGSVEQLRASGRELGDGSQQADDTVSAIGRALDQAYNDVLTQEVPAGMTSDEAAQRAISDLLTVGRTKALFGFGEADLSPIVKLVKGAYNRAQERCAKSPANMDKQISVILGHARSLALLGSEELSWDELMACAHFKMTFDSTITTEWGGQTHGTHVNQYRLAMPLTVGIDGVVKGEAPGTYVQATGTATVDEQKCGDGSDNTYIAHDDEVGGTGDLAKVPAFTLPREGDLKPKLELALGSPTENYHEYTTGGCSGDAPLARLPRWSGSFMYARMGDGSMSADGHNMYVFVLDPGGGATIGSRTYGTYFTLGGNRFTEHTTITVVHTPAKYKPLKV